MENSESQAFLWYQIGKYLDEAKAQNAIIDNEKKCFTKTNELGEIVYRLSPPVLYNIRDEHSIEEYRRNIQVNEELTFAVFLIQAGAASLGVWVDGECIHHKVITAYMVRKKQGKSQLTHLNQKGKSRQGSRIRLNNSIRFFENINVKLEEWLDDIENCDHLFFSCTPRLWGELFRSKVSCPIDKEDIRWRRIPMDIKVPNFKELQRVARRIMHGRVTCKSS
ncbi:hypothetical protein [Candidatus Uabimicrobium sp. HlEnr_7]|uniref:hypothetical protein n=1 Tax=Candidatus Uabimicrobium helgolandensis TaxID=3095367 RepID=UPI003556CDC6